MPRGRRRDKTYTATHGGDGPSVRVGKLDAMVRGPVSVQDRVIGPSPDEMRRAIANAECPFCGKQFDNIAGHTNRLHGVSADELKAMAGIPKSYSVCSTALREKFAVNGRHRFVEDPEWSAKLLSHQRSVPGRVFSPGGLAVQRAKLAAMPPDAAKRGGQTTTRTRRARSAERDQAIVARVKGGATSADVCAEFGIHPATVKRALKYAGIKMDLRAGRRIRL